MLLQKLNYIIDFQMMLCDSRILTFSKNLFDKGSLAIASF